jgi:hypothetical protein
MSSFPSQKCLWWYKASSFQKLSLPATEHDYHVSTSDRSMSVVISIVPTPTFMQLCLSICARGFDVWIWNRWIHSSNHSSQLDSFTSELNFHRSNNNDFWFIIATPNNSQYLYFRYSGNKLVGLNIFILFQIDHYTRFHYYKCNVACIPK